MQPSVKHVARRLPGLVAVYRAIRTRVLLGRGTAPIDYPDTRILIRTTSRAIVAKRLHPRAKEPWTVAWLARNVRNGDVVYDIGANVGAYTLIAAHLGGPSTRVIAFEPAFATYASLCENVLLNDVPDRVTPLQIALAAATHLAVLSCASVEAGEATHELDGSREYDQPILAYGLDELVRTFALPPPTLVKIDVDGAESEVLAGARQTLAHERVRSVLVEVDDSQTDAVVAALADAALTLNERITERDGARLPGVWYGIFSRSR
jgi:FkbM family methyltransferase